MCYHSCSTDKRIQGGVRRLEADKAEESGP